MDVESFLAELHSTLEQLERQIRLLEQFDARAESEGLGPGLSPARQGSDRMCWLQ